MTIASLLLGTIISQILFVITKIVFLKYLKTDILVIHIAFQILLAVITIAVVRRMGTLNYIESFFLTAVWFFTLLVVDFVVTATLIGRDMYTTWPYWISYVVILLALILFHKKMHIELRKENAK